ncbi:DUF2116 family Zn-ribbon domain-containing protein [Undibacterium sp. TC9W]|uniref:DUF2116 family Zn-ribbon domain-containing protein n=1 Tax=Undibacterium sp. TC9W TaxID=3413053 RepID=UPI003BF35185
MSDIADSADARISLDLDFALNNMQRYPVVESDLHCLFCDEPVGYRELFCNADCRYDYEREQKLMRIAGR